MNKNTGDTYQDWKLVFAWLPVYVKLGKSPVDTSLTVWMRRVYKAWSVERKEWLYSLYKWENGVSVETVRDGKRERWGGDNYMTELE